MEKKIMVCAVHSEFLPLCCNSKIRFRPMGTSDMGKFLDNIVSYCDIMIMPLFLHSFIKFS